MTRLGGWGVAGASANRTTTERNIYWGDDRGMLFKSATISGATRDAGNTPTTVLRSGLLMGQITSGGKFTQWDSTATDGSQLLRGILDTEMRAQDYDATNADRQFRIVFARGPLKASQLLIKGLALVGHADEYLARRMLRAAGFVLDDDPFGYLAGAIERVVAKAADYTVLAADNGTLFTNTGAAAKIVFTLPTIAKGLTFKFYSTDNDGIRVTSAVADTITTHNDVAADSIDLAVTGRNIGAMLEIRANEDATAWLASFSPWNIADDGSTISKAAVNT